MAADIGHISQLLNATLDPSQHRKGTQQPRLSPLPRSLVLINKRSAAEAALKQEAARPQYSLTLLNIVNSDSLPINTRLSAALAFKNFIRSNYVVRAPPNPNPASPSPSKLNFCSLGRGRQL